MNRLTLLATSSLRALEAQERVFTLVVALAIGLVSGFWAIVFRVMIFGLGRGFALVPEAAFRALDARWLGIVLMPALGGLIIGPIIWRFAPEARGHGVPEVMAAVLRKGGFIRPRVAWIKALASAICIGSGGSVGREGPIVQIGSSLGSSLGYLLRVPPRQMRTFVACGAAGGISATFNAPIAGALFAVEIILRDFGFIQLGPIVTSAVIAAVVSRSVLGNFAAFAVPPYALLHPAELVTYAGLGLLCGLAAVLFIATLGACEHLFEARLPVHPALRPAAGGLVIGGIGLLFPQVFGIGYEGIGDAMSGGIPVLLMALLVLAKLLATTVTLGSGGSGGIFAPSLFMGAMLGGVTGHLAHGVLPGLTAPSGAYSLVGMAAMVGAATQAPLTGIVIIFELTNDYRIILPLMISTIIAVFTATAIKRESIYTHKLRRQGIDPEQGLEADVLKRVRVREVMRPEFEEVPHDLPFTFLVDQLLQSERSHLPVVDDHGHMLGTVERMLAAHFLPERGELADGVIARDVVNGEYPFLLPADSLSHALFRFNESGAREMYVLQDTVDRTVVGVVRKGDLMDAYYREMVKRSSGDAFAYSLSGAGHPETVRVMEGYGIIEVEAPHAFSGRELRELDLRNRYGINVLAIKRTGMDADSATTRVWVPDSTDRLEDGDVLVLLGRMEKLDAFQQVA
jgi:chloride channel protein, CIC family